MMNGVINMHLQTTRFGAVEFDDRRTLTFPSGLLGFSNCKSFALLQPNEKGVFYWLQSLESPALAFVVTNPEIWVPAFQIPARSDQLSEIGITRLSDAQCFVIVNRYESVLTANLQGPLVINSNTQRGVQLVLADKRWSTRHEIVRVEEPALAATA